MSTTPPVYITGDSPPSYEEVVQKFEGLIGSNTNAVEVYDAASKGLTKTDLKVLIDNYKDHLALKTDKDKADFARGTANDYQAHSRVACPEQGITSSCMFKLAISDFSDIRLHQTKPFQIR